MKRFYVTAAALFAVTLAIATPAMAQVQLGTRPAGSRCPDGSAPTKVGQITAQSGQRLDDWRCPSMQTAQAAPPPAATPTRADQVTTPTPRPRREIVVVAKATAAPPPSGGNVVGVASVTPIMKDGEPHWLPRIKEAILTDRTRFGADREGLVRAIKAWGASWQLDPEVDPKNLSEFLDGFKVVTCDARPMRDLAAVGTLNGKTPVFTSLKNLGCAGSGQIVLWNEKPIFFPGSLAFLQVDRDPGDAWSAAKHR